MAECDQFGRDCLRVAVAVVFDDQGRVLVTQRAAGAHQGGLWEFPGGKLETGESVEQALRRELEEEVGLAVEDSEGLIDVPFDYSDRRVCLHVRRVLRWRGQAYGREGQAVRWLSPGALDAQQFPSANRSIIAALRLPSVAVISPQYPSESSRQAGWWRGLESALQQGYRLFQLRVSGLEDEAHQALASEVLRRVHAFDGCLLINGDWALARAVGADGLHLKSAHLLDSGRVAWPPEALRGWRLLSASCHDEHELGLAQAVGVDFALLSPLRRPLTPKSGFESPVLAWQGFARLAQAATMPVYALAGVSAADLSTAKARGGQGVAGISAFWPCE